MKAYKTDPTRFENKAIAAHSAMILDRIELGWHASLLTLTLLPLPNKRVLPPEAIGTCFGKFYSLVLTRLIHHPRRGSANRLPFMVGMPDLPVFKHRKASVVATINDGLHAHAIFLTPPLTRKGCNLAAVLERDCDIIKGICHLMRIHQKDITETPGKANAYVMKSLDLNRFDGDHIWIFPKAKSELSTALSARRAGA